ncbi:DUF6907 domain-containing protein [Streptomyces sp. 4N124]|uniref:DUF6907 domain-containing protein n=1 Tax=Streptomyces sp. 4N124 TaxID=3457420 RepID=UPI003FCFF357
MGHLPISTSNLYPLPEPRPGHRFVPVKVGATNDTSVIVLIEDPTWCSEDHVDELVRDLSDIMHRGAVASVHVPTFGYGAYPVQMHSWVEADPVAKEPEFRAAHVTIQDAGGNDYCHLTPAMAEKLADDAIGFASELRHQARTARLANKQTSESDPDMDESLRRVQGGAL